MFFLAFPAAAFLAPALALGGVSLRAFGPAHWLIVAAMLHLAACPSRERRVKVAELAVAELKAVRADGAGGGGRHPSP